MRTVFIVSFLLFASSAVAQQDSPANFSRLLLPIYIEPTAGAFGSLFESKLQLFNAGTETAEFRWWEVPGCQVTCPDGLLPAGTSLQPKLVVTNPPGTAPGALLYVRNEHAASVQVNLRVQDTSRQALTWGTQIPVIGEAELFRSTINMINVPTGARFRQTVRIYEPAATGSGEVEVRVYGVTITDRPTSGSFVGMKRYLLAVSDNNTTSSGFKYRPGYAQISWLEQEFPALASFPQARVEIIPLSPGLRFWTFTSVTNNETQHITVVAPDPVSITN